MLGLAFASVPLYRIFCQVTGFDGTTMRADAAPGAVAGEIGVRFDANIVAALPWKFEPEQATVRIQPGARTTIFYRATNLTARTTTGHGELQRLARAGRAIFQQDRMLLLHRADAEGRAKACAMPVVFFVDPKLRTDPATRDIDEITLSYTFYPVENRRGGPLERGRETRGYETDGWHQEPRLSHPSRPIPGRSSAPSPRSP